MVVLILGYTLVSVVFKTQRELKCQNELFSTNHFSENTSVYVFVTKIIWRNFDVIIDNNDVVERLG